MEGAYPRCWMRSWARGLTKKSYRICCIQVKWIAPTSSSLLFGRPNWFPFKFIVARLFHHHYSIITSHLCHYSLPQWALLDYLPHFEHEFLILRRWAASWPLHHAWAELLKRNSSNSMQQCAVPEKRDLIWWSLGVEISRNNNTQLNAEKLHEIWYAYGLHRAFVLCISIVVIYVCLIMIGIFAHSYESLSLALSHSFFRHHWYYPWREINDIMQLQVQSITPRKCKYCAAARSTQLNGNHSNNFFNKPQKRCTKSMLFSWLW